MSDALRFLFHTGGICIAHTQEITRVISKKNLSQVVIIREEQQSRWPNKYDSNEIAGGLKFWRHLTIEGSKCRPRNDSSRLHNSPLPSSMKPVTSQKTRGSWRQKTKNVTSSSHFQQFPFSTLRNASSNTKKWKVPVTELWAYLL